MHYVNAWLKRCVFNLDLNRESVSEPRTLLGRLFLIICFCDIGNMFFSKDKLLSNITPRFLTVEEVTGHPSSCKL